MSKFDKQKRNIKKKNKHGMTKFGIVTFEEMKEEKTIEKKIDAGK